MKKYIFTVFAVAAVLSSCSKNLEFNEDINSGAKAITTIGASTEISTRAVVSSSDNTKVLWETGDKLGVLGINESSETSNLVYPLDGDAGSTTGTFKNEKSDITAISAIMYPYQASASWDGTNSKLTCEIPPVQKATKGTFDKAAAVMYSIGNTTNVKLNYAVNFLKVAVSETNVHAISISSSNALSGKMKITSSGVTAASSGSLKAVTLIPATGNFLETGVYYIAVKAGDIENPTISYVYLDQTTHTATEKSKAGSGTLTFSGKNVKPISVDFTSGTVTTRNAFQLWAEGPYFAEYNVGVTDGKAESYGGYYCWGKTVDKDATGACKSDSEPLSGADDTATKLWGANWRMPTADELGKKDASGSYVDGLLGKCTCAWKTLTDAEGHEVKDTDGNTVKGLLCTGQGAYASNSVFLPAAGRNSYGSVSAQGNDGRYWSSTPYGSSAYGLYFGSGSQIVNNGNRDNGYSVRAVLAEE